MNSVAYAIASQLQTYTEKFYSGYGWTSVASQPNGYIKRGHGTDVYGKKIYSIQGMNTSSYSNLVDIFDTVTNTMSSGAVSSYSWTEVAVSTCGTKLYCFGGYNGSIQSFVNTYSPDSNSWSNAIATVPSGVYGAKSVTNGTDIYLLGGYDGSYSTVNNRKFNTLTNTFSSMTNIPVESGSGGWYGHGAVIDNGKIFVARDRYLKRYNISTNSWDSLADNPEVTGTSNFYDFGMCVKDSEIYVIGGYNAGTSLWKATTRKYTISSNSWSLLGFNFTDVVQGIKNNNAVVVDGTIFSVFGVYGSNSLNYTAPIYVCNEFGTPLLPDSQTFSHQYATVGNNVYIIGGRTWNNSLLSSNYMYNTITRTYTTKQAIPFYWYGGGATSVGTSIYVMGGDNGSSDGTVANYLYDTVANTWTQKQSSAGYGGRLGTSLLNYNNTNLFLVGPASNTQTAMYTVATNTWSGKATNSSASTYNSSVVVGNNIYSFGGFNSSGSATNWIIKYDIAGNTWSNTGTVLPNTLANGGAFVEGDNVYYHGGSTNGTWAGAVKTIFKFNTINLSITTLTQTSYSPRLSFSYGKIGSKVYMFGGGVGSTNITIPSETFDTKVKVPNPTLDLLLSILAISK